MSKLKVYAHGSYIGDTGYNHHTRDFFRELSNHVDLKVRNFTVGKTWEYYTPTPHDKEPYFNEIDRKILYQQILWNNDNSRSDYPIYPDESKNFFPDLNLVLSETNHHIFYDHYNGPKIAYNVWESTLQPQHFFDKLMDFDELWVPSKWQKQCTIEQGYPEEKIKVVPEGVDVNVFYPDPKVTHPLTQDGRFKFFLAGRWDYRKSTREIIETFLSTFDKNEPVDLIISVDNPFSNDKMTSTEERLEFFGLNDDRIKVLHFPPRDEYINLLKSCNVFVSCARAEGWNLPLIEAMASGTVSIYSNCSGQLEFAESKGVPVRISKILPVSESLNKNYNHHNQIIGDYYEPDYEDLSSKMRFTYEFYDQIKKKSLEESIDIREKFSWENVAKIGHDTLMDFMERKPWESRLSKTNEIIISYLDGPRVEIKGDEYKEYFVEFINKETNQVLHSGKINNNMWIACSKKYYIPWQIRIDGFVVDELNLKDKTVLISMESRSIGDTIAWAPYVVKFAKKHQCKVLFSTFHNEFFEGLETYKDIQFINPGESHVCNALYRLGWFKKDGKWEDKDKNPNQPNVIPLQKAASDILGLPYREVNYGLNFEKGNSPIEKKYVCFGPNATSGCKEWSHENWVTLSKMIREIGYEVVILTQKPFYIENTINIWGEPFDVVANYLHHASAFIGLGSGLSWFNWGLGKHTHMINGFARPGHEFSENLTRIFNPHVCIYCWNDEVFVFDSGDWDWCPVYKGTKKQHICQRGITPLQVFQSLDL